MVKNDGVLPLDPSSLGKVAVIGHNARYARTQGGGSATVLPEKVVTPLDGVRAAGRVGHGVRNGTVSAGKVGRGRSAGIEPFFGNLPWRHRWMKHCVFTVFNDLVQFRGKPCIAAESGQHLEQACLQAGSGVYRAEVSV
ncbi:glycoside hydrolase family 3 C-terminal domain-containing protein [Pseudarthrobacter sp. NS4]|uniref:glycoside hydrolase family 3 C-terminal domain-containing protein n=1 Tax=Pseudarthrobacter sp. NS4 TaxID=2973976 RepID=UPI002867C044|nr:glycoside hydrolase family 3 C-terminal domain-containing protein [Pseudarthrobacter sp. NS4]